MSLTTAVSEDDDAESVHNSPYKAKQVEYIFSSSKYFSRIFSPEWLRSLVQLHGRGAEGGVPEREEVAAAEEAPGGAGQEAGLEGLLGVSEGHDSAVLSLRLQRGELVVAGD